MRDNVPVVGQMNESFTDTVSSLWGVDKSALAAFEASAKLKEQMGQAAARAAILATGLRDIPEEKSLALKTDFGTIEEDFSAINDEISALPEEKKVEIKATHDPVAAKKEVGDFIIEIDRSIEGQDPIITITATGDDESINATKKKIDDKLPHEKLMEIKLQGEIDVQIATIEAQAETLQSAFEWTAKVDIAKIEAGAKRIEALAETSARMFEDTGKVLGDIIGAITMQDLDASSWLELSRLMAAESARRDALIASQVKLNDAEAALITKKTSLMEAGQGLITITADGVYPELELVLHKIIELAQVQANAEGMEYLLGV
jgi:hypothetical protein